MKVITNKAIIKNRRKWASRIAPLTMLFLIGGLITNFLSINQPQYFQYTLGLLALGFVSAIISSHLVTHWVREPRADQLLATLLRKFGNDYAIFNYTAPPSHILLTPARLYVIVTRHHDGQITVAGNRFSRSFTWKRFFKLLADEGLGNPANDARKGVDKLQKILRQEMAEEEVPEIASLVLFTHKEVDLTVHEPEIPVLQRNQLKSFLREHTTTRNISAEQRQTLTEIIGGDWADEAETA